MSTSKWDTNQWEEGQAAEEKVTLSDSHHTAGRAGFCEVLVRWVGADWEPGALPHLAVSWQQPARGRCQQVLRPLPAFR